MQSCARAIVFSRLNGGIACVGGAWGAVIGGSSVQNGGVVAGWGVLLRRSSPAFVCNLGEFTQTNSSHWHPQPQLYLVSQFHHDDLEAVLIQREREVAAAPCYASNRPARLRVERTRACVHVVPEVPNQLNTHWSLRAKAANERKHRPFPGAYCTKVIIFNTKLSL